MKQISEIFNHVSRLNFRLFQDLARRDSSKSQYCVNTAVFAKNNVGIEPVAEHDEFGTVEIAETLLNQLKSKWRRFSYFDFKI